MRPIALLIAVLFTLCGFGQDTYLWKVSSNKDEKVSYLLGTHHQLGESYFKKYPILEKSLLTCQQVVTEVEINRDSATRLFDDRVTIDLAEKLGEKNYAGVRELLQNFSINPGKLSPAELVSSLQRKFEQLNCEALVESDRYKLDEYIQVLARRYHLSNHYLETMDQQFDYLGKATKNQITWSDARRYTTIILKQYSKFKKSGKKTCPALLDRYLTHHIEFAFNKSCQAFNDKQQLLVVQRNQKWLKELSELLKQNNVFIAVGAEHLIYECGLIMQLKKMGYSVEPVVM